MEQAVQAKAFREARDRADMLDAASPRGLRVVQITTNPRLAHSHIYMEAPVFTPDSRRFVFKRILNPEEENSRRVRRELMLCDVSDAFSLRQLTDEAGVTAPCVAPDGKHVYYVVDNSWPRRGGDIMLKRVWLDSFQRETLVVIDAPPSGCRVVPSRIYPLSSISPDGKRLTSSGFLGDGKTPNAPWGLLVFDLEKLQLDVILEGEDYCNMHPQYCRDHAAGRDILVQHNHGCVCDEEGDIVRLTGGAGADVHVVRDDGTDFRDIPWGRDGKEFCQGHQCWRGEMLSAVSSMSIRPDNVKPLVESLPVRCADDEHHTGKNMRGGTRNEISRGVGEPLFCHFAFDRAGTKFISDTSPPKDRRDDSVIVVGSLDSHSGSTLRIRHLLRPRSSWAFGQQTHPHPFLSPDGTMAFFNSDVDGLPQIWMAENFEYP